MIHLGAMTTHIALRSAGGAARFAARRPATGRSGRPPRAVPGRHPRCLHSPKVRHTVAKLTGELTRAPGGELAAQDMLRAIVLAMGETPVGDYPGHHRTIHIR
jgi:hypothetical protein